MNFMDASFLRDVGPRQFPRQVERLLMHLGFTDLATIDGSGDGGADVLGWHGGRSWVLQCKWKLNGPVGAEAVDEVQRARELYGADEAAVVTTSAPGPKAIRRADELAAITRPIKFWTGEVLRRAYDRAPTHLAPVTLRPYQHEAVAAINADLANRRRAMLILATGMGKTVVGGSVIAEHLRHATSANVLVVAHTRDLVAQLERALWTHLSKHARTRLLTGDDRPDDLGGLLAPRSPQRSLSSGSATNLTLSWSTRRTTSVRTASSPNSSTGSRQHGSLASPPPPGAATVTT
ncbi:restriction endonuclease [Micromonospora yangpuensis]|uniref:restriction endonuclease n=1 Tax=Micromonospora yangpuensis TaxID=683228 RepID=UPI002454D1BE|nr:restriction endonuclease [Micromonospora yangpuensis]